MDRGEDPTWSQQPGGDVSIILGAGHTYLLHSWILRKHSPFFAEKLTEANTPVPERRAREQGRVRWRLELVERPEASDTGAGALELLAINEKGQILPQGRRCPPDLESSFVPNPIYHHYDRVLGALHGMQFHMDDENITTVLRDVLGLMEVAEYLGCVGNVSSTVETAMLTQGITLYRSIIGNPGAWALLATRVRSELVFKEAVIHLVGRWNEYDDVFKADLPDGARAVCERKHEELTRLKVKVEQDILKYYPGSLQRDANDGARHYNRQAYSNDIMGWIAITLYKHWFASALVQDRHRHAPDGGFWLYSVIGEGGHAYLAESEVATFHKRFPMSVKGAAVFQDHLMSIKQELRRFVKPVLQNRSQLDPKEHGLKYLTCTVVNKRDLPWIGDGKQPPGEEAGGKRRMSGEEEDSDGLNGMNDDY